ncbi:hypothetical protein QE152_g37034 [Popillia japonica]|uniref:Uncharacterized protein n=1 Tax=Popillia japonica TaxID=7064 RepID=A0AAW1IBW6_POPJA
MKALLALIVMSGIYAMPHQSPMQSNDLAYSFDESTFLDRTQPRSFQNLEDQEYKNLHRKIYTELQRYYHNKLQNENTVATLEDSEMQRTAYWLIKTMKQREKRYSSSYLTLCHFKICNMGRKRTTRYFHMIKSLQDDHT